MGRDPGIERKREGGNEPQSLKDRVRISSEEL